MLVHSPCARAATAVPVAREIVLFAALSLACSPVLDLGGDLEDGGQRTDAGDADAGGSSTVRLALGGDSTCALRDQRIVCWGRADRGQVGVDPAVAHDDCGGVACEVAPRNDVLPPASALALGRRHGCLVTPEGDVACWGDDAYGQLGRGTSDPDPHPTPAEVGVTGATRVAGGAWHSCAVAGTELVCWGLGDRGQLGIEPSELDQCPIPAGRDGETLGVGTVACARSPRTVPLPEDVESVALGAFSTCAISRGGVAHCFGANTHGEAGVALTSETVSAPTRVSVPGVVTLALGGRHGCAVVAGGGVRCWGSHASGQLGVGSTALADCSGEPCAREPTVVSDLGDAAHVATGDAFTCVAEDSGATWCWGDDQTEQLGNSSTPVATCTRAGAATPCSPRPTPAHELANAEALGAGDAHACAARSTGAVVCWGDNRLGQGAQFSQEFITFPFDVYGLWP